MEGNAYRRALCDQPVHEPNGHGPICVREPHARRASPDYAPQERVVVLLEMTVPSKVHHLPEANSLQAQLLILLRQSGILPGLIGLAWQGNEDGVGSRDTSRVSPPNLVHPTALRRVHIFLARPVHPAGGSGGVSLLYRGQARAVRAYVRIRVEVVVRGVLRKVEYGLHLPAGR